VAPLPHRLYALNRAMSRDRVRYLLADEVGLGKTIEAGVTATPHQSKIDQFRRLMQLLDREALPDERRICAEVSDDRCAQMGPLRHRVTARLTRTRQEIFIV
jgi:hypothetical protein